METLAHAPTRGRITFRITSERPTQFIDLTDHIEGLVAESGICTGLVNVHTLHTTTGLIVNENEPLLLADFAAMLERSAPAHSGYLHDDPDARTVNVTAGERPNGHAHCRALLLPTSVSLNVIEGRVQLGRWQRVFLVELDGPRPRLVSALVLGADQR